MGHVPKKVSKRLHGELKREKLHWELKGENIEKGSSSSNKDINARNIQINGGATYCEVHQRESLNENDKGEFDGGPLMDNIMGSKNGL